MPSIWSFCLVIKSPGLLLWINIWTMKVIYGGLWKQLRNTGTIEKPKKKVHLLVTKELYWDPLGIYIFSVLWSFYGINSFHDPQIETWNVTSYLLRHTMKVLGTLNSVREYVDYKTADLFQWIIAALGQQSMVIKELKSRVSEKKVNELKRYFLKDCIFIHKLALLEGSSTRCR